jgi:hypothetical protein
MTTAIAKSPPAPEISAARLGGQHPGGDRLQERLWLRATDDGWALVTGDGDVVFSGVGVGSRRACLRRAADLGVLAVLG